MYLKELTITGFKSFAKKGELEFSAPITAIVGPNGSGKSNVAESFRFVLGEQSVKAMRGKKGEDLIWGGSEKIARANRASVALTFDNQQRNFALDFDAVTIERIVHRDGQNEYKLNGSAVRLKDIHELLASANIGSTGHHIISQGEADRVLAAGPKERREMIEDALGLKVYQLKKAEAERKLTKTLENSAQVESLRREAAPHLRYLQKQVERAERAIATKETLQGAYAEYLKREDTYLAFHTDRLHTALKEPRERLQVVQEKLTALTSQLAESHNEPLQRELHTATTTLSQVSEVRQQAERERSTVAGQVELLTQRLNKATQANQALADGTIPQSAVRAEVDKANQALLAATGADAHGLKSILQSLLAALEGLLKNPTVSAISTAEADQAELNRLEHTLASKTKQVEECVAAEMTAAQAVEEARSALETATTQNHEAEKALFALREEERELRMKVQAMERELHDLECDRAAFKTELQEAVALLGRAAAQYFSHEVTDSAGNVVSVATITGEDRSHQHTRRREVEKLKIRLEELGIGNTTELLKEFNEAKQRDEFLAKELADLSDSVENLRALIADLDQQLQDTFRSGIEKISVEFNRFFTLMFGGGAAKLSVVQIKSRVADEEEARVEEGVELHVSLPNKRVNGLDMLSGGERALTSIAVIFAMSQVNPPPFIILDETDAALDEANSRRYGDMIEELAKRSQLVLITHNRETMSRAGILFGITMGADGASRLLSVKFDEAVSVAK
jgi:chromosome segregation protein